MTGLISSSCSRVIIGLGKTGLSCVRYLARKQLPFKVVDTRDHPPGIDVLTKEYPDVSVHLGGYPMDWLLAADELVVSPGIAITEPAIVQAAQSGVHIVGDIELFCREVNQPVVAITGSNGKSTVTTLLGQMAVAAGRRVGVGGNIGTPALDLLKDRSLDLFVLELSSFQLETTHSLKAMAATILNMSHDHMDRYGSMVDYHRAKQRIYRGCQKAVYNKLDPLTTPLLPHAVPAVAFTTQAPDLNDFGLIENHYEPWLCKGTHLLMGCSEMKVKGQHNQANALAALALGESVGLPLPVMLDTVRSFTGLEHRCQWVAEHNCVVWINDSKATNVGACVAAIKGLGETLSGKIILIAGGDGKGASFEALKAPLSEYGRAVILLGRDAPAIERAIADSSGDDMVVIEHADSLATAVVKADQLSKPGDLVLLAPACASFDMFASFEQRGHRFVSEVKGYLG